MKTLMLFLVVTLVLAVSGTASASQGTTITLNPPGVTLLPGSTVTYEISINTLPAGLSGFQMDFQLTNPAVGQVTRISFPSWAKLSNTSSLPAGRVTISAADLGKAIEDGAAGTTLARVTVEAKAAGTSNVRVQNLKIDDDHGGYINPDTTTAQLTVKPGGVSTTGGSSTVTTAPTPLNTLVADTPTASPTPLITTSVIITQATNPPTEFPAGYYTIPPATPATLLGKIPRWILYVIGAVALVSGLVLLVLAATKRI